MTRRCCPRVINHSYQDVDTSLCRSTKMVTRRRHDHLAYAHRQRKSLLEGKAGRVVPAVLRARSNIDLYTLVAADQQFGHVHLSAMFQGMHSLRGAECSDSMEPYPSQQSEHLGAHGILDSIERPGIPSISLRQTMKIAQAAAWSHCSTDGRLNFTVTTASSASRLSAANTFSYPAAVVAFEHLCPST